MALAPETLRFILGFKLRQLRHRRGLGLQELSRTTGLSISYLSEIEKGKKYPKPDKLLQLSGALGVGFDDLVSSRLDDEQQPLSELFESPFLREFPFHQFGVEPEAVLALLTEAPLKTGALLKTVLEVGRNADVRVEHFLFAALRSYQTLHRNYFEEIEKAARELRADYGWAADGAISYRDLRRALERDHGLAVDEERLGREPALAHLRSVWIDGDPPRLLLNPRLLPSQKAFQLGRELGYLRLGLEERSTTSSPVSVDSYDQVVNDFQAAYFSGAVLIDGDRLTAELAAFLDDESWSPAGVHAALRRFDATPETFFYRLSQIVPGRFGLGELFFLRLSAVGEGRVRVTKILNLSKVPVPHGVGLDERHCRRWPGLELLRRPATAAIDVAVQRSRFLEDDAEFFVVALARPLALTDGGRSSVSLGFRMTDDFRRRVRFADDPAVPRIDVGLTCERCRIDPCAERAAPPTIYAAAAAQERAEAALAALRRELVGSVG